MSWLAWTDSDRRARLPANWATLVRAVKKRDGNRCTWFDDDGRCPRRADEVDHVVPGDDHSIDNLRSLCSAHHAAKSAAEGVMERARRRALTKRPVEEHPSARRSRSRPRWGGG